MKDIEIGEVEEFLGNCDGKFSESSDEFLKLGAIWANGLRGTAIRAANWEFVRSQKVSSRKSIEFFHLI